MFAIIFFCLLLILSTKGSHEVNITVIAAAHVRAAYAGCADRFLGSFRNGTAYPRQVVIIFHAPEQAGIFIHNMEIARLEHMWSKQFSDLVLIVEYERSYKGRNLDTAISRASSSLISMFDIDDVPHPQRLEMIHMAFDIHPDLDILLTGYTTVGKDQPWISILNSTDIDRVKTLRYDYRTVHDAYVNVVNSKYGGDAEMTSARDIVWCCSHIDQWPAHMGWSTSRIRVFDTIHFSFKNPEAHNSVKRGGTVEDSVFVSKAAVLGGFNISATDLVLGRYNQSPQRFFSNEGGVRNCYE
jgi:hypothetical protein